VTTDGPQRHRELRGKHKKRRAFLIVFFSALSAALWPVWRPQPVQAHIGSPDVFVDANAGPYRLLVTIRPPHAIPGVAEVEVLATSDDIQQMSIVPLPLSGPGAQFAPVPDVARRSPTDPRLFSGTLWMMTAGAWQVRIAVTGAQGPGQTSVPVPTLPKATLAMSPALGVLLSGFATLLGVGLIAIVSTAAREAGLEPGERADPARRRRGRIAGAITTAIVLVAVYFGNTWWGSEALSYSRYVYKPLEVAPTISAAGQLQLSLSDPGWLRNRRLDDFVNDHGHPMHLFVVSPTLDRLWHLHPTDSGTGTFAQALPEVPAGTYELFGDLVHATGVAETVTATFSTSGVAGLPLSGDDSAWAASEPPNGRIVWVNEQQTVPPKRLTTFTFRVDDELGQPAVDLQLYMGMPGHAVFFRRDRQVFAHVHPSGSAPMAALAIASPAAAAHAGHEAALPPTVSFPYGFPEPGDYRIFVQVKRGDRIVTGTFDTRVE
jgi:hypothetical protein